jgi:hypothetical protein
MAKQVSNGTGVIVGQSATDLVAFHGATATDQYVLVTAIATAKPVKASSGPVYAFSTSTAFKAAWNLLKSVRALLVEKGLSS